MLKQGTIMIRISTKITRLIQALIVIVCCVKFVVVLVRENIANCVYIAWLLGSNNVGFLLCISI